MRLISLELNKIRSYDKVKVEFPEGSVLLSGDIGSGKSSLLLAIEFALFGLLRGVSEGAGLLRHGARQGSVTLEFAIDGKHVIVQRTLQRTKTSVVQGNGFLIINNAKEEFTPTELKTRIMSLFGYPEDQSDKSLLYRYTVYTSQEKMKEIILATPELRLTTLRSLFNIDKYKRAYDNIAIVSASLRQEIAGKDAQIGLLGHQIEQREPQLQDKQKMNDELILLEKDLGNIQQNLNALQSSKTLLQEQYAAALQAQQEWQRIDARQDTLRKQKISSENKIKELKQKVSLNHLQEVLAVDANDVQTSKSVFEQRKKEYDTLYKEYIDKKGERDQLLKHNALLQQSLQQSINVEETRSTVDQLCERVATLDEKKKELKTIDEKFCESREKIFAAQMQLEQLASKEKTFDFDGVCPTCEQQVSADHKEHVLSLVLSQKEQLQHSLKVAQDEKSHFESLLSEQRKSIEQLEVLSKKLAELRVKLQYGIEQERKQKDAQEQIKKNKDRLSILVILEPSKEIYLVAEKEYNTLFAQYREYTEYLARKNELEKIYAEIKDLEKSVIDLEQQIAALDVEKDIVANKKQQFDSLSAQLKEADGKITVVQQQINKQLVLVEQARSKVKALADVEQQILNLRKQFYATLAQKQRLERLRTWLNDAVRPLYTTIERHVMISIYREFNSYFSEWCAMLLEDENTHARLDNEFSPVIEQDGHEVDIDHMSGGERTSVALAYRLALNRVVNHVLEHINTKDVLILDEPTEGFSTEQLDKVREVLLHLHVRQLVIVSHEAKMESFVDHVIHVEKVQGESVVK